MGISLNSNIPTATAYVSSASGASASGASGASASSGVTATAAVTTTKEVVMYTAQAPGTGGVTTTSGLTTTGGVTNTNDVKGLYTSEEKEAIVENYKSFCEKLQNALNSLTQAELQQRINSGAWATVYVGNSAHLISLDYEMNTNTGVASNFKLVGLPSVEEVENALKNGQRVNWEAWNGAK